MSEEIDNLEDKTWKELKEIWERLERLENDLVYLREGHSNHLQKHNEEISELKDFVDLIFEMINNAGKDMENIESVLKADYLERKRWCELYKLYPNPAERIEFYNEQLKQLDGEKEEIDPELMERIMSKKAEPMKKSSKYKCLDCNRIWNSLQLDQNNKGDLMCPICDCTGFDITEEKPSEPSKADIFRKAGLNVVTDIAQYEQCEKEKQEIYAEFLEDIDEFHDTLLRIKESRASGRLRGIIPEVACILEEEIHSYSKEGYKIEKWQKKRAEK